MWRSYSNYFQPYLTGPMQNISPGQLASQYPLSMQQQNALTSSQNNMNQDEFNQANPESVFEALQRRHRREATAEEIRAVERQSQQRAQRMAEILHGALPRYQVNAIGIHPQIQEASRVLADEMSVVTQEELDRILEAASSRPQRDTIDIYTDQRTAEQIQRLGQEYSGQWGPHTLDQGLFTPEEAMTLVSGAGQTRTEDGQDMFTKDGASWDFFTGPGGKETTPTTSNG